MLQEVLRNPLLRCFEHEDDGGIQSSHQQEASISNLSGDSNWRLWANATKKQRWSHIQQEYARWYAEIVWGAERMNHLKPIDNDDLFKLFYNSYKTTYLIVWEIKNNIRFASDSSN